jgi:anti-sigma regulatory factor (Ser/Thr protein kinase)/anti-anti-sigma regulatory factor
MVSTQRDPLDVRVDADPRRLGELRGRLTDWLVEAQIPGELADRLVLAANEAATNAIVHAYRDSESGPVHLHAETDGRSVVVTVSDEGTWKPAHPGEGPGGRGVLIMQESMDDVRIERGAHGTTVTLRASAQRVPDIADTVEPEGDRHRLDVRTVGNTTVARLRGSVRPMAATHLRRQLLAATCGGVVPLVLDLAEVDTIDGGVAEALEAVAHAADGAGERVVVVVPTEAVAQRLTGLNEAVQIVRAS